jgi:hypothetical protein
MFDKQRAVWIYDQYRWLERCVPSRSNPATRTLVTPTSEYFPDKFFKTHQSAEAVFNRIRALMGMSAWECTLVQKGGEQAELDRTLKDSGVFGYTSTSDAAGTFSKRGTVTITYSPDLLSEPLNLVAILAHELSHYLLAKSTEPPKCSKEDLEPLTDLCAVAEGFGLFSCHAAFQFNQWGGAITQGWSALRLGYMSEAEFAFGIGVFCIRNHVEYEVAARFLRPNPRQVFMDSLDFISDLEQQKMGTQSTDPKHAIVTPPAGQKHFRF